MIHVDRRNVESPSVLRSARAIHAFELARDFFRTTHEKRRQNKATFDSRVFRHSGVRTALYALFHRKCAFCETPLGRQSTSEIDHFRPKFGAVGRKREYSPDHYWWLAYEWTNLHTCCFACSSYKGEKFPVTGERAPLEAPPEIVDQELRLLIDPCRDDPSEHLWFTLEGMVQPRTEMGAETIETMNLNRDELVAARRQVVQQCIQPGIAALNRWQLREKGANPASAARKIAQHAVHALDLRAVSRGAPQPDRLALSALNRALRAEAAFAGMSRNLVDTWLAEAEVKKLQASRRRIGITESPPRPKRASKYSQRRTKLATRRIVAVTVHNFRAISHLKIECLPGNRKSAPWTMLLGENSTGKSSILQAIALALMGEAQRTKLGILPEHVLRSGTADGYVHLRMSGKPRDIELRFRAGSRKFTCTPPEPSILLLGYGATRLLPRLKIRPPRSSGQVRVQNLFNPFVPLIDARNWLRRLKPEPFDYTARAIKDVLSLAPDARLRPSRNRDEGVCVRLFGKNIPLASLSDGYQSVIGLTADLIKGLNAAYHGGLEVAEGIALVDELGAHLHPRWRMRIIGSLRKAFPRVQFFSTTHDPLCLRGLGNDEVTVLRRSDRGRVFALKGLPPIEGLRVDQLLTSEYFGLHSVLDPAVEAEFAEYYRLLVVRRPSPAQQKKIKLLRAKLTPLEIQGTSRREQLLLHELDKFLAQTERTSSPAVTQQARAQKDAAIQRLLASS